MAQRGSKRLLALRGDGRLAEYAQRGNEAAFEVIYERHVPGILSFCRHMLGSPEEAEDAVQHTFAAAYRALLHGNREVRLKPWLYAIARNRCLSILRARRRPPDETLNRTTEGLEDEVQRRADLRDLVADLQDLPEDQRAALILSELRDLSQADVAEALDCPVANVKGLVFRARSGLIMRREARSANCAEIQRELATARGGALRRGELGHHLRRCPACSRYLEEVREQRKLMTLILPAVPAAGLKQGVLATVDIGGGAGAGGAATGGGGAATTGTSGLLAALPVTSTTVAQVAAVGVLVGGAGVAGEAALKTAGTSPRPAPAVAQSVRNAPSERLLGAVATDRGERPAPAQEQRARPPEKRHGTKAPLRVERNEASPTAADAVPPKATPPSANGLEPSRKRLSIKAELPVSPQLPLPAALTKPPRLPVGADLPEAPRLPIRTDPQELTPCAVSSPLCN